MSFANPGSSDASIDYVLIGTGLAPLIAARELMANGKTVAILNPQRDFFLEGAEFPLDPELGAGVADLEEIHALVSPYYPGSVEKLSTPTLRFGVEKFQGVDRFAPVVRSRERLIAADHPKALAALEALYLSRHSENGEETFEWVEGLKVLRRFPGYSKRMGGGALSQANGFDQPHDRVQGLWQRSVIEMDVTQYCEGILNFLLERLGTEYVQCSVADLTFDRKLVRFRSLAKGIQRTTWNVTEQVLMFWTDGLTEMILDLSRGVSKRRQFNPELPRPLRWERWSVTSRDPLDLGIVGVLGDTWIWAEHQRFGSSNHQTDMAAVLRPVDAAGVASEASFRELSTLFHDFLGWDRFSVRALQILSRLEFAQAGCHRIRLERSDLPLHVLQGADGPVWEIVKKTRDAVVEVLSGEGA